MTGQPASRGFCGRCGHAIKYHGPDGCDVEVRDYGDTDCGCTAYTHVPAAPASEPTEGGAASGRPVSAETWPLCTCRPIGARDPECEVHGEVDPWETLRRVKDNALSWHGPVAEDDRHAKALAVIAKWCEAALASARGETGQ